MPDNTAKHSTATPPAASEATQAHNYANATDQTLIFDVVGVPVTLQPAFSPVRVDPDGELIGLPWADANTITIISKDAATRIAADPHGPYPEDIDPMLVYPAKTRRIDKRTIYCERFETVQSLAHKLSKPGDRPVLAIYTNPLSALNRWSLTAVALRDTQPNTIRECLVSQFNITVRDIIIDNNFATFTTHDDDGNITHWCAEILDIATQ